MYTPFQLAKKYLKYQLNASNGKGHGTHSPFVFHFITKILNDNTAYPIYSIIEQRRKLLLKDSSTVVVQDFGAGSGIIKEKTRQVNKIATTSLKPAKYAQLLFRMVQHYKPRHILELGTSLGITTSYLATANPNAQVITCEGAQTIADIAQAQFDALNLSNIHLLTGEFTQTLPTALNILKQVDFAFIDGNHRKQPTLNYFEEILNKSTGTTLFVLDDIHWSQEMEEAWMALQTHPAVTLTIDLFFIGVVFINPDFKVKQHFTTRF